MKFFFYYILILLNIFIFISTLFFFLITAKNNNTWPFNSGLGSYLPNIFKSYGNKIVLSNLEDNSISTHFYSIKSENFSIPSVNAIGLGGAINVLEKNDILITLDNGEIFIFNTLTKKFTKNIDNLINEYESIRDVTLTYDNKKYFLLGVLLDSNNCKSIVLDRYDFVRENKNFILNNKKTLWVSENMCEDSWTGNSGGRIVINKEDIYISVGMFISGNSGINKYSQNNNNSFGKIIKISSDESYEIFTSGHRNPQGLFFSNDKKILFSTEHGPNGGDELNIIKKNNNYGWPCRTVGTHYDYLVDNNETEMWPKNLEDFGCYNNKTFTEPLFTWTPSIAISQGFQYKGNYFEKFKNNIIIGSLAAESIFRIILSKKNTIMNIERIPLNFRVRDILETNKGKILVYTDSGNLTYLYKDM